MEKANYNLVNAAVLQDDGISNRICIKIQNQGLEVVSTLCGPNNWTPEKYSQILACFKEMEKVVEG
jgi:hypothetical protein